jgi:hypothetical protein
MNAKEQDEANDKKRHGTSPGSNICGNGPLPGVSPVNASSSSPPGARAGCAARGAACVFLNRNPPKYRLSI